MANKTRFSVNPELEEYANKYIQTVDPRAVLEGAQYMDITKAQIRIWWRIPAKTENNKDFWTCKLMGYSKE